MFIKKNRQTVQLVSEFVRRHHWQQMKMELFNLIGNNILLKKKTNKHASVIYLKPYTLESRTHCHILAREMWPWWTKRLLLQRLCAVFALVLRSVGLSPAESPVASTQITRPQTEGWCGCDQNMRWAAGNNFSHPAYPSEDGRKLQQFQALPSLRVQTTWRRHVLIPVVFRCCSCSEQSLNQHGQVHHSGSRGATGLTAPSQKPSPFTSPGYFEMQPTGRRTRVEVGNRPRSRVRGFGQLGVCQRGRTWFGVVKTFDFTEEHNVPVRRDHMEFMSSRTTRWKKLEAQKRVCWRRSGGVDPHSVIEIFAKIYILSNKMNANHILISHVPLGKWNSVYTLQALLLDLSFLTFTWVPCQDIAEKNWDHSASHSLIHPFICGSHKQFVFIWTHLQLWFAGNYSCAVGGTVDLWCHQLNARRNGCSLIWQQNMNLQTKRSNKVMRSHCSVARRHLSSTSDGHQSCKCSWRANQRGAKTPEQKHSTKTMQCEPVLVLWFHPILFFCPPQQFTVLWGGVGLFRSQSAQCRITFVFCTALCVPGMETVESSANNEP